ncbi:hypothetical protein A6A04_01720 [Paramagnetospirillum marisnigri]|uniref:Uncharacterized protein n=1 Tax=Paramagnetospirillum marisnigri TaxID=1285242 RepID=A0A178MQC9_9PROT|nr:hypothetical protein [Paramagnetospirillum marisnigri]OAN50154.1 hypothetical protein A6A04_01720 [Paramagnetospirillum marisnigri]
MSKFIHKMVDGVLSPLTSAEIVELEAREAQWAAGQAERDRAAHNSPILAEIAALDARRVRPAAEVALALASGNPPAPADLDRLASLTAAIAALRGELQP